MKSAKLIIGISLILAGLITVFWPKVSALNKKAHLSIQIEHAPVLLPAAYKVYADETILNGKYGLFKMLITNNSDMKAEGISVSYEIPGFIPYTTLERIPYLMPGQSYVINCFPAFNKDIVNKMTASKERVNINITGYNIEPIYESRSVLIRGRNELVYSFLSQDDRDSPGDYIDNAPLINCFVTPDDPIIKYFTQQVQEKILKGEAASVFNTEQEGVRFLQGLYDATRLSHMVYSGTTGVPMRMGDMEYLTQSIRLPREVLTGKTGLCIELSTLYASVMMAAGMNPVIYLLPGHAFPGFELNGSYYGIEATGIGGEGLNSIMSADQALQSGMRQLVEFMAMRNQGRSDYMILDMRELADFGFQPIELGDDQFLRTKVDELAKSFETPVVDIWDLLSLSIQDGTRNSNQSQTRQTKIEELLGQGSRLKEFDNFVYFKYPIFWGELNEDLDKMVQQTNLIVNKDQTAFVQVYRIPLITNTDEAIHEIMKFFNSRGFKMQYSKSGTSSGYQVYKGKSLATNTNKESEWVAYFKRAPLGCAGLIVGNSTNASPEVKAEVDAIINSIR